MLTKSKFVSSATLAFLVLLVFLVAGCSFSFEGAGKKVDETMEKVDTEKIEKKAGEVKELGKMKFDELIKDLEAFEMEKIDEWAEKNNLNEYGDEIDTIYEKGSPLIEKAGGMKERYQYILENHPELVEELELEK